MRPLPGALAACLTAATLATATVHHDIVLRLDPATGALHATDRIRPRGADVTTLRLAPPLAIDRVAVDGQPRAVRRRDDGWHVDLGDARPRTIDVEWHGTLPRPAATDVPPLAGPEGTFLAGDWHPRVGGALVTWTLDVELPAAQRAVAPGRLVSDAPAAGRRRVRFASEAPTDEVVLFAGPYALAERDHGGRALRAWLDPAVESLAPDYLARSGAYLDLYEEWIGRYPFSGFAVVSSPLPVGLGFPGLTYVGTRVLRLPFILDTSLGHEVLHSWWGNGVLVDPGQGNWAEGLTTFMADHRFAERRDPAEARRMRLGWLRDYAVLPRGRDRPLTSFRGRTHAASQVVGYHKAAMLFLMLRDDIGAPAFDAGVRRFWTAQRFRVAGWRELETAFAGAAGRRLDAFFGQWLERPGAPSLVLRDAAVARGGDGWTVRFTIAQEAAPWLLRVPVVVETAGEPVHAAVALDAPARVVTLTTAVAPRRLAVDPDVRVFRRLAPAEVPPILRSVAFDPAAVTLVAAPAGARAAARALAAGLLERPPRLVDTVAPGAPLLVVGTTPEVAALLARLGLPPAPDGVGGRGTARAWAARQGDGTPLVVVAGNDAAALAAASGPLPHLGAQSFVVFEGRRPVERGVWPPEATPLEVDLAGG